VLRAMEAAGVEPDAITARALDSLMRSLANALRTFDSRFRNGLVRYTSNTSMTHLGDSGEDMHHLDG
jgi:hypothetical protein